MTTRISYIEDSAFTQVHHAFQLMHVRLVG